MMYKIRFWLVMFMLAVMAGSGFAQSGFDDHTRAVFIFDIVKYVTWKDEAKISSFTIAVIDSKENLSKELEKMVVERKTVHNKPISIKRYSTIEEVQPSEVLFVNKEMGIDINKVLKLTDGKGILLITENYEFQKSMINFIVVKNQCRFELNEAKISQEGFKVTPLFSSLAVKTKADWEALYKETDVLLQKEKEIVEQQNKEIERQKKEIAEQTIYINQQKAEILKQQAQIDEQKVKLGKLVGDVMVQQKLLSDKIKQLAESEKEIEKQKSAIVEQTAILDNQKKEISVQEGKIEEQKSVLNEQLAKIKMQQLILWLFVALALMLIGVGFFIYRAYKVKKQANKMLHEKNEEIMQQNEEIRQQKEEIEAQRDEIERQNGELEQQRNVAIKQRDEIAHQKQEIMDSIHYARRIQTAVLPPSNFISQVLPDHFFILNRPRDVVSGDYYWMAQKGNKTIIAAADCTGHGVPGAFMSLLGVAFLNEIINKIEVVQANSILNELREYVIKSLNQARMIDEEQGVANHAMALEIKDGMDMALVVLDLSTHELQFAGANNPIYIIRKGEIHEIKADKQPIGLYDEKKPFSNNVFNLEKDDTFYIFSDGYPDQFGGPKGKKFKYGPFKELLINVQDRSMVEQYRALVDAMDNWKKGFDQVDDILVIGVKI